MPERQATSSSALSPAVQMLADTPSEAIFDRYTALTAEVFGVPVSLISVLDETRQYFKSMKGLEGPAAERRETPLTHSFCQHVVRHGEPLIVTDAREDALLRTNGAVVDLGVVSYAGAPIFDDEGNAFAALCAIDSKPRVWSKTEISMLRTLADQVTSEIAMRLKLQRMGIDLQNLRAMEETRRLIARADRHDLRTPLNSLLLNLQAIGEFGELNEDQAESLRAADRGAREVLAMVDQLLDIGTVDREGKQALTLQKVSAAGLLREAAGQIEPLAHEAGVAFQLQPPRPDFEIVVDEEKFTRVLVNLLANGVKFTLRGGKLDASASMAGEEARFVVRDTGIGLAPEDLPKLFQEGFKVDRTAKTRRSTGLGLTFCKRIVDAHGGRIIVESELGRGTVFTIALPAKTTP